MFAFYKNNNPTFDIFSNDENGFYDIIQFLHLKNIDSVGFESTGVYHKKLHYAISPNRLK